MPELDRRHLLAASALAGLGAAPPTVAKGDAASTINDITGLNPVRVARSMRPASVDELQAAVKAWPGALSIGGGRFSMVGRSPRPIRCTSTCAT